MPVAGVIDDLALLEQRRRARRGPTTIGSSPRCTSRTSHAVEAGARETPAARRREAPRRAPRVPCGASASPSWASWLVPTIETSRHGTRKRKRPSHEAAAGVRAGDRRVDDQVHRPRQPRRRRRGGAAPASAGQQRRRPTGRRRSARRAARMSKRSPVRRSSTRDAGDAAAVAQERQGLDVVGRDRAAVRRRQHGRERRRARCCRIW